MFNRVVVCGLKARDVTARGKAPGQRAQTDSSALQGRDMGGAEVGAAFQALGDLGDSATRPFRPGCHMTGLRPGKRGQTNAAKLQIIEEFQEYDPGGQWQPVEIAIETLVLALDVARGSEQCAQGSGGGGLSWCGFGNRLSIEKLDQSIIESARRLA